MFNHVLLQFESYFIVRVNIGEKMLKRLLFSALFLISLSQVHATVKLQQSLTTLKQKLGYLSGVLVNMKGATKAPQHGNDIYITLVEFHITDLKFQTPVQAAIVNAANDGLWAGGGVCGAIFSAADREDNGSEKMQDECNAFTTSPKCPTGEARITRSYGISKNSGAHYVIHAVGPSGGSDAERKKDLE